MNRAVSTLRLSPEQLTRLAAAERAGNGVDPYERGAIMAMRRSTRDSSELARLAAVSQRRSAS